MSLFYTSLFILLSLLFLSTTAIASDSRPLEILYWPVTKPEPSVLAHVTYDPASLKSELVDYSPPSAAEVPQNLVRVGFYLATPTNPKQWVGTLTSPSAVWGNTQKPTLRLHISSSDEVYHVSLASEPTSNSPSSDQLLVELVANELGPRPQLNRPIVVGPDGKNPEELPEKTLFQKYWWVFLILTFLAMSGGGEQQ
ncbi:uncharacterized protein BJX67DRAFT_116690 [Aspergillus lucknowensis]|uniref:Uncharacterized protein n=1 Tax=Aspergillus lucknowensis TaxID=176173 RepID=A0ABR4LQT9_9EURO